MEDLTQNVKLFKLGKKLLFDNDVKKICLYDYNMFKDNEISYKTFIDFNGPYLKIPVEKGIFSFEYIIKQFNLYKEWINS